MFKLAVFAFAASNVAGTPLHQNAIGDKTIIVTFDGLTVRYPHVTTSIGVYDGLNFSNIYPRLTSLLDSGVGYQDFIDGTGSSASASRPSSRNKVGLWRSPPSNQVGKSPPSFGTKFSGSTTDTFDLKSFKYGCAPGNNLCEFVATGTRGGTNQGSQVFGASPAGNRFGTALPDPARFSNLESVHFDTGLLNTGALGKPEVNTNFWIDEIEVVLHRRGSSSSSTSTTTASTKTRATRRPLVTKPPVPLPPLPPFINCPDVCVANTDDCGQTWGGCFEFCLATWPTFTAPTVCTITLGGLTTTGEVTATTVIVPTSVSLQVTIPT
ncbi:hypothetical protein BJ166DRAFT_496750 [Pestalotiopsis sp. NC0098]|nr:hypothetical protein BJ166DRAFT_496750 [Pestalotiopsis sp. NC0098]